MLCGIALCNNYVPARFVASLAIIMCKHYLSSSDGYSAPPNRILVANLCSVGGSWFTDRPEQEVLIGFLQGTEQCSGWLRGEVQKRLIEDWGWTDND